MQRSVTSTMLSTRPFTNGLTLGLTGEDIDKMHP